MKHKHQERPPDAVGRRTSPAKLQKICVQQPIREDRREAAKVRFHKLLW